MTRELSDNKAQQYVAFRVAWLCYLHSKPSGILCMIFQVVRQIG